MQLLSEEKISRQILGEKSSFVTKFESDRIFKLEIMDNLLQIKSKIHVT